MNAEKTKQTIKKYFDFIAKHKFKIASIVIAVSFVSVFALYFLVKFEIIIDLPSDEELIKINNPQSSELYANNGKLLAKYYLENRKNLKYEELGEHFPRLLVCAEDKRFYTHNGIDYRSLARVFIKTILLQNKSSGGGSTITQQLVKNVFKRENFGLLSIPVNKFKEHILAKRLEKIYSKKEIITLYSNTVSFGEKAFGLSTASHRFFNKQPKDLSISEAATLVGILKAPSYYSPRIHPQRATQRRNLVLSLASENSIYKGVNLTNQKLDSLALDYQNPSQENETARYFKAQIKREFNRWCLENKKSDNSEYHLYKDGLRIYTTLDLDMQITAEKIMASHMSQLQKNFIKAWEGGKLFGKNTKIIDDWIKKDPLYKNLKSAGKTNKEILTRFTTPEQKLVWDWEGDKEIRGTKIDSIKHYLSLLHSGILGLETRTGAIKVWVGGNDFSKFQLDNIISARQVGSTFKPIVYLTALEQNINACDYFKNELRTYTDYDDWTPKNANDEYGGEVTLFHALMNSMNTVSVQVLFRAGIKNIVKNAKKLGIVSQLSEVPSMVLGTSDISLFEMVQAYAVLGNHGVRNEPYGITRIESAEGDTLYIRNEFQSDTTDLSIDNIQIINSILRDASVSGTGKKLHNNYNIPFEISGKTGTTQNQSDGWYIAYNGDLTIGSWVGTEDRRIHFRYLGSGAGSSTALPMVAQLFEYAAKNNLLSDNEDFAPYIFDNCEPIIGLAQDSIFDDEELIEIIQKSKKRRNEFSKPRKRNDKHEDFNDDDKLIIDIIEGIKKWNSKRKKKRKNRRKNN